MDDSTLKSLKILTRSNGPIEIFPAFYRSQREYTVTVGDDDADVKIQAIPNEGDAFVQVQKASSDGFSAVPEGSSEVTIKVDAADGSSSYYKIVFYRPSPRDSALRGFKYPAGGTLLPDFHKTELSYTLYISDPLEKYIVEPIAFNAKSKVKIQGVQPMESGEITLHAGDTDIDFEVTSPDGSSVAIYHLTIRKEKSSIRPKLATSPSTPSCSICTNVPHRPRKIAQAQCDHQFCFSCLDAYASLVSDQQGETSKFSCPLCYFLGRKDVWGDANCLKLSDQEMESRVDLMEVACPWQKRGCTVGNIPLKVYAGHLKICAYSPKECVDCFGDLNAAEIEAGKHSTECTGKCPSCSSNVPLAFLPFHQLRSCSTILEEPLQPSNNSEREWETTLVDKKKFSSSLSNCINLAELSWKTYLTSLHNSLQNSIQTFGYPTTLPDITSLSTAASAYATAIALDKDRQKVSGGSLDAALHLRMGIVMQEMENCGKSFPVSKSAGGKAEAVEGNEAASESFMNDEVEGLLMGLGVPKSASDATKIKAMEEEYHRLLGLGQSNQAAEVQNLHMWKVRQVAVVGSSKPGESFTGTTHSQSLLRALEKYQDAININPLSFEANFHLGRFHLTLRDFTASVKYLARAASLKPANKDAATLLIIAFLHMPTSTLTPTDITATSILDFILETKVIQHAKARYTPNDLTAVEPLSLTESIFSTSHPIFSMMFTASSRSHRLQNSLSKSVSILQDLLYLLPDETRRIPKRGSLFTCLLLSICDVKKLILQTSPNPELQKSLLPTLSATLKIVDPCSEASRIRETTAQLCAFLDPANPTTLAALGDAILEKFDTDKDVTVLDEAVGIYEVAIEAEKKSDDIVKKVSEWEWFKRLVDDSKDIGKFAITKPGANKSIQKSTESLKGKSTAAKPRGVVTKPGVGKPAATAVGGKTVTATAPKPQGNTKATAAKQTSSHSGSKSSLVGPTAGTKGLAKSTATKAAGSTAKPKPGERASKSSTMTTITRAPVTGGSKKTSPTSSKTNLAKASSSKLNVIAGNENGEVKSLEASALFQTRLGLARALCRRFGLVLEKEKKSKEEAEKLLDPVKAYYLEAIKLRPDEYDAYVELGPLLEKNVSVATAANLYASYPFRDLSTSEPSSDDIFLYSELTRLFIKEKRYRDPKLTQSMIAEGRAMGIGTLSKYIETLDSAGESKVLMEVYAGVNRKPVDHPDLVAFFKARFWL
ncbi:hypothetical protein HDU67_000439 [Dinochytrium kinnereticum]|nr:hypothetical protein HDU67_000439 [Dinochytrium kinnereticum]